MVISFVVGQGIGYWLHSYALCGWHLIFFFTAALPPVSLCRQYSCSFHIHHRYWRPKWKCLRHRIISKWAYSAIITLSFCARGRGCVRYFSGRNHFDAGGAKRECAQRRRRQVRRGALVDRTRRLRIWWFYCWSFTWGEYLLIVAPWYSHFQSSQTHLNTFKKCDRWGRH